MSDAIRPLALFLPARLRSAGLIAATSALALLACDPDPIADAGPRDAGPPDAGPDTGVDGGEDAGPDADAGPPCVGPPGLYADTHCSIVAAGVRAYRPRYVLWSDDADKERYIFLPDGDIDTSDPDNWVFPVGTVLYKTFSHDGVRLETRLLTKTGPTPGVASWRMQAFAWNAAQTAVTDVTDEPLAVRENVLGTMHDIPGGVDCQSCHSGALDVINGFGAIQINHADAGLSLEDLIDEGRLSDPIDAAEAVAPGDATASEALGYLHANCGHCHRYRTFLPDSECADPPCGDCPAGALAAQACGTNLHTWLRVGTSTVEASTTYDTAVEERSFRGDFPPATCRIAPGEPDLSVLLLRMEMDNRLPGRQMPPLGTEIAHPDGLATVRAWIDAMPAGVTDCTP